MKVTIVGHGPSLLQAKCGAEIDAHDIVVRLKRSWQLLSHSDLYGSKTDIVMGSIKIIPELIEGWQRNGVDQFWVFEDPRTKGWPRRLWGKAHCLPELCQKWQARYRELREPVSLDPRQTTYGPKLSDERGHRHPSAGMHAIIYALELLKPDELTLYGFDSLLSGAFDWSVTRGPDWEQYPDHNWKAEKDLLDVIAKEYDYSIDGETLCKKQH